MTRCFYFVAISALCLAGCGQESPEIAANKPYDETADAKLDLAKALATPTNTPILIVFGANWCSDCKALDAAMKHGASAALLSRDFRIIKVDVGRFNKNRDLAESYGVFFEKGIPSIAIVSPTNKVLYVTQGGELRNAEKMSDDGIYQFFKRVTESARGND